MTEDIASYEVQFKCYNCGHTWTDSIDVGHLVENKWNGCIVAEDFAMEFVKRIKCPNCECSREVKKVI